MSLVHDLARSAGYSLASKQEKDIFARRHHLKRLFG